MELVACETTQQVGFTNTRVSNEHHLEQVAVQEGIIINECVTQHDVLDGLRCDACNIATTTRHDRMHG